MSNKFEFVEGRLYFDISKGCSKMFEGKFKDTEQENGVYIYANLADFDSETLEESDVYIYPYSFAELCCPEEYQLNNFPKEYENYLKKILIEKYHKTINQKDLFIETPKNEIHFYDLTEGSELK